MKLAEALSLRADRNRVVEQLRNRIAASARYQEGEQPSEDANELLAVCGAVLDDLQRLIRQINATNSVTVLGDGRTLTDALAERDVLRLRFSILNGAADAGSGSARGHHVLRSTRSELRVVTDLDVRALRQQASDAARRTRELDSQIQQANWATDLIEEAGTSS